jgi:hypothetical protein
MVGLLTLRCASSGEPPLWMIVGAGAVSGYQSREISTVQNALAVRRSMRLPRSTAQH